MYWSIVKNSRRDWRRNRSELPPNVQDEIRARVIASERRDRIARKYLARWRAKVVKKKLIYRRGARHMRYLRQGRFKNAAGQRVYR